MKTIYEDDKEMDNLQQLHRPHNSHKKKLYGTPKKSKFYSIEK